MNELLHGLQGIAAIIVLGVLMSGKQNLPEIQGKQELKFLYLK